ncbi:hypothetical protein AAG906_003780 [Vitis piasezkii]
MATNNIFLLAPQIFARENYQIWSVKMQTYLEAFDLWEVVAEDKPIAPLPANPTLAQIKAHTNEKTKKFKAKTLIQNSILDSRFHRIMNCRYDRIKQMQVLNLKRDFESLTMQEDETITKISDARIVEKVLVTLPERFESKISSLEESRDLSQISLAKLMNALQAQEQRRALRQENQVQVADADSQEEKLFVASCFSSEDSYNAWFIDSGCTHRICHNATIFKDLDKTYNSTVKVDNGGYVDVKERGTVTVKTNSDIKVIALCENEKQELCHQLGECSLVERPKNHKVIGVKWVFKTKLNLDGSICKHKAKLVTFALVARYDTIKLFFVLQPNGVVAPGKEDYVCLLRKTLYGLKQAPNDMLVTGNQPELIQSCKDEVNKVFEMTDLRVMKYFLGMENHVQNFHMPIEKLSKDDISEKIDEGLYRSLIGSLLYLIASRPDILFTVSVLSRFMHSPSEKHFSAAKRVLRYIKGIVALGVQFSKSAKGDLKLLGYSNNDWGGFVDDSRSTSGYLFFIGSSFFTWSLKKQETITQSTTEVEYIVVASVVNQALWLRKILKDLGQEQVEATNIMCDNISAVSISKNLVFHGRTKHIKIKYHFIREVQQSNEVLLVHCSSKNQLADIFTKPLPMERFEALKQKIGVCHPDAKEECSVVGIPNSKP